VVRGGVEPPTFRFSGASGRSLGIAGRGLICRLAGVTVAGGGWAWPGSCLCWLPVGSRMQTTQLRLVRNM
jgi:hypothetical protein